ncbi:SDR family NAD(P)-dependent oxidoreductase [Amycolatopsis rhizosphaerae]|uniref:SDR family NAD(P)-dependent oxidoreductase n=1 Tax=Amycolatopsis rhizosphaerae TaxID=2053003 RepID=A0A558A6C5_9PSEU|nr:oxidoreductase [Amycolatopsis rhizosphaerae]TVT19821.1 SDR family NAD(P)-dependent oxidoreductase [Amycolatopsis rhizosphaerae]
MRPRPWTAAAVPAQHGRTAVVTGANTGLGFETARMLAERGATVVLACRDAAKAAAAAQRIRALAPRGRVTTLALDLASQASVHRAAERLRAEHERIDLLVNNAGGMRSAPQVTEDGFECTLATNHLGPFAFTGLVLDRLLAAPGSRVVTVSSIGHLAGRIRFDDPHFTSGYRRWPAYFQSKLANLMFTFELDRRLAAAGAPTVALAAHPGNARTEFGRDMNRLLRALLLGRRTRPLTSWFIQDPEIGALATVRAAADPAARGGDYYGPAGFGQFTGSPVRVRPGARAQDAAAGARLWRESERLTGVRYLLGR